MLEVQSSVFKGLLRKAQRERQHQKPEFKHGGLRIVDVDENSKDLERLLRFLHPAAQRPQLTSMDEVLR